VLHRSFAFPNNNLNFIHQKTVVENQLRKEATFLYFNDKYIFWKAYDSLSRPRIIVTEFEEIIGDTIPVIAEKEVSTEWIIE
jgi:hypothetical protein